MKASRGPTRILAVVAAVLGAACAASAPAAPNLTQIDVVVDMTPAGRKVPPPSAKKPAYYLPVVVGYQEMGNVVAGEKPPQPIEVIHLLAAELARQGYFVMSNKTPPSLILGIHWGYMNPQITNFGSDPDDPSQIVFFNKTQMLGLVAGNTLPNLDLNFERREVMQASERDRYFVGITAYDYDAYANAHKKVVLWQAKMSVPSNRVTMDQVIPILIKAGGPLFGRETLRPKMLVVPVNPEGRVEIGAPTVKDYQDAPQPPPPAPVKGGAP